MVEWDQVWRIDAGKNFEVASCQDFSGEDEAQRPYSVFRFSFECRC